jgi:hypothetical protein
MEAEPMQPAWYLIRSDHPAARWFNVIHWPYTLFHLSYVVAGGALAQDVNYVMLGLVVLAFFFGMGIAAHCFDLVAGDPLKLALGYSPLLVVGYSALATAMAVGVVIVLVDGVNVWLGIAIPLGFLFAIGYGLEWPGLHGDWQFVMWWAIFPFGFSYLSQGIAWDWSLILFSPMVYATAYIQRMLSTRARFIRREQSPESAEGAWLLYPIEKSLAALSFAMPMLAGGLLLWRL